jgi:outer membrane protein W
MGMSSTVSWRTPVVRDKAEVDIDPWIYSLGVGYKF